MGSAGRSGSVPLYKLPLPPPTTISRATASSRLKATHDTCTESNPNAGPGIAAAVAVAEEGGKAWRAERRETLVGSLKRATSQWHRVPSVLAVTSSNDDPLPVRDMPYTYPTVPATGGKQREMREKARYCR
jgi:hypothetical protein